MINFPALLKSPNAAQFVKKMTAEEELQSRTFFASRRSIYGLSDQVMELKARLYAVPHIKGTELRENIASDLKKSKDLVNELMDFSLLEVIDCQNSGSKL